MTPPPDPAAPTLPPHTLEFAPADPAATLAPRSADSPVTSVPGYELLGELGRGGMGVVYKARQTSLKRIVALKMVIGGAHAADESFGRFRNEAEAVARLRHPNIVQVYEVSEAGGTPFFSLEFLEGGSLDQKLAGTPLPPREAAALVRTLALAIQHAHDAGIVHRDLKPANVLLDTDGSPKVTDFGLAKSAGSDSGQTRSGAILGTPSYMAPEQAAGDTKAVGPIADVYALGAILYECLTGRPPFRAATPLDTVLQVISEEPVPPTKLQPATPRDLETVCLKSLHKKPERRYASAADLAADLQRWLDGEPIQARPIGWLERVRLWRKKNPRKFRAAAIVFFIATLFNFVIVKDRREAREYAATLEVEHAAAEKQRERAEVARLRAEDAEKTVQSEKDAAVARLYATSIDLAHREWQANNVLRAEQLLNDGPANLRGWEWDFVKSLCRQDVVRLAGHFFGIEQARISPDGKMLATSAADGLRVWDLAAGREILHRDYLGPVAFSPDGKTCAASRSGRLALMGLPSGQVQQSTIIDRAIVTALAFTPDGAVAVAAEDGLYRWNLADNSATKARNVPQFDWTNRYDYRRPTFSRDGTWLAACGSNGNVTVWEAATGVRKHILVGHAMHTTQAAFSPDGKYLASAGADAQIILWNLTDGKEVRRFKGHMGEVKCVAFNRDGTKLASGSEDRTARLWDVANGETVLTYRGHTDEVQAVCFAPDGKRLVSGGGDKVVRVWDAEEPVVVPVGNFIMAARLMTLKGYRPLVSEGGLTYYGHPGPTLAFAFSPDGRLAATSGNGDPTVTVWDASARKVAATLRVPGAHRYALAFAPDGKTLATVGCNEGASGAEVSIWDVPAAKTVRKWVGPNAAAAAVAFGSDGKSLAVGFRPAGNAPRSEVIIWDVATGTEVNRRSNLEPGLAVNGLAYAPGGKELVVSGVAGVAVWAADTGVRRLEIQVPSASHGVAVAANGLIATAGQDAVIRLWSLAEGSFVRKLEGHVGGVRSVAFSPDGSRLVSCGDDMTVKVWETLSGRELLTFRDHRRPITQVGWSPDGTRVASCGFDGTFKVWEAKPSAAARSDEWPLLFVDAFERDQIGPAWTDAVSQWTVENGRAVGTLKPLDIGYGRPRMPGATLGLAGIDVPTTFDLRYDLWTDKPMLASTYLSNASHQSLQPYLNARQLAAPLYTGAALLMMSGSNLATPVGVPRTKFVFEPNRVYRVRVVREPKTMSLFVDGIEVLAERIPDFEAPALALTGTWGEVGNKVAFDNVELRAPAGAIRARALLSRVEMLLAKTLVKAVVAEELNGDPTLTDADRTMVAATLARLSEDADKIANAAAAVAEDRNRSAAEYALGLRQAEAAAKASPQSWWFAGLVGLARHRVGKSADAIPLIDEAIRMARQGEGRAQPKLYAALALAAHSAGRSDVARDAVVRLRDALANATTSGEDRNHVLVTEALRQLDAVVQDVRTKDAEAEAIKKLVWESEQAGWDRGDLAAYMAVRADDYRETVARCAEVSAADVTLDRAQTEAVRRVQFKPGRQLELRWQFEDAAVTVNGDTATLRYKGVGHTAEYFNAYQFVFELRRTDASWRVTSRRAWPYQYKLLRERKTYDSAYWSARDKAVEEAKAEKLPRKIALALHDAQRDAEAYVVARTVCDQPGTNAADWSFRGDLAVAVGEAADAEAAFRKALALDGDVELPWYKGRGLWVRRDRWQQFGIAFLPDGRVVSGGGDKMVRVSGDDGRELFTVGPLSSFVASVAPTPDGRRVVASVLGGENEVAVIDLETRTLVRKMTGHGDSVYRVGVSPDGRRAVSASADGTARVWDLESGRELLKVKHDGEVLGATFHPDGTRIATASHDKTAREWDATTGRQLLSVPCGDMLKRVEYSPDGTRLAVSCVNGTAGEVVDRKLASWKAHKALVEPVTYRRDGRVVATGGDDGTIRLWDAATRKKLVALGGFRGAVFAVAFNKNGSRLASAAGDGTIRVWDVTGFP